MQWWCAVQEGVVWNWSWQPYPGVWLFVLLLAAGYLRLVRRRGEGEQEPGSRYRLAAAAGIFSLWAALDWPLGPLGAGYLASVHMVQYLLIAVIGPSLLLVGVPPAAWERLERNESAVRWLRAATWPPLAVLAFAGVAIVTHLPSVVDPLMRSQLGSFGIDLAWFLTGIAFWMVMSRRERSVTSNLVTVAAAALIPLVMGSRSLFELGGLPELAVISAVCFGYFFGTMFYVKTIIRERGHLSWVVASVAWHLLWTVIAIFLPVEGNWLLVMFFAAITVRAFLVPWLGPMRGRNVRARTIGIWEMVTSLVLAAVFTVVLMGATT